MWWKIILGVIGLAVVGFIGMVIKMAITEAKEAGPPCFSI